MAKIKPLMVLPPVIFAGLAGLFYVGMQRDKPNDLPSTFIGQPAPTITSETLGDFAGVGADDLITGDVTLVNFWASWCPPCRAEHPVLLDLQKQGLQIYGVNIKDDPDQAIKYINDDGNPFAGIAFDPQGRTAIDWGVTAPPETFIVDGDGSILFRYAGPLVGSDYMQRFVPALEQAQAK